MSPKLDPIQPGSVEHPDCSPDDTGNHPEMATEKLRLVETKLYLEQTLASVYENRIKFKDEIKEAYIHLDHLDSSLSFSKIMLNSTLLDDLEKNFDALIQARKKPYFARMDIVHEDRAQTEEVYLGKVSLYDPSLDTPMVVDWRAPVASVYYDGRLGKASYQVDQATKTIDLLKKRQYTIADGELLSYMDVDISTSDTFLQAALDGHAGDKLKDIVSTIQAEQNQIIRAPIDEPLIIQGAAGSGKTTIALHRIAYLIYTYADSFYPEDFMIIAPSSLFLDYISGVLPELGANKVRQTTYIDLMNQLIGKKLKLTDSNHKLNDLIRTDGDAMTDAAKDLLKSAAALKNSLACRAMLDRYLKALEQRMLPEESFYLDNILMVPHSEIKAMFFHHYGYLPFYKRMDSIRQYLAQFLKNRIKGLLREVEAGFNQQLERIRHLEEPTEARRQKLIAGMEKREQRLAAIKKASKTAVKKYIAKFHSDELLGFYAEFNETLQTYASKAVSPDLCPYITEQARLRNQKLYEVEDLAPLVYLKSRIFGLDPSLEVRMVFIDEAQDLSAFQIWMLKTALNTERFTILGDLAQGIHSYRSITNWGEIRQHIFKKPTNYLTLEQSYRTTIEIMDEANRVMNLLDMESIPKAKPVVRHGAMPLVSLRSLAKEVIGDVEGQISAWQKGHFTTIAVITKTLQEAAYIAKHLKKIAPDLDFALVDEKSAHFDHPILILPAHLAKGLEFDAVIVAAIHETFDIEPLDIKLMYVAMTRAMHRLAVIGIREKLPCYRD